MYARVFLRRFTKQPSASSAFRRRPVRSVDSNGFVRSAPVQSGSSLQSYPGIFISPNHNVAQRLLNEPTIVIERQMEMMNVLLGFEQANKYSIMDSMGNRIGYMMERDMSIGKAILRQIYKLHRPFTVDVFDNYDNLLMTIRRPFSWINSHIKSYLPQHTDSLGNPSGPISGAPENEGTLIGESVQNWHLWRRRYELFQRDAPNQEDSMSQFGQIDAPFLSFDFPVTDSKGLVVAGVDRNWVGLGRELFTDTGVYIVRFDSQLSFNEVLPPDMISDQVLTLDQRAVLLANAVSIDFDYFSRHSRTNGGLLSFGSYDD